MRVLPTKLLGRLAAAGAAGALALGMTALPASADPPADVSGETLTLDCGNAGTYEVVTAPGEGQWTPAFDTKSNKVFIPVAFGPASGSVTVVETGEVIDSFSDDSTVTKGGQRRGQPTVDCTYSTSFTESDEELGELFIEFSGEVTVFIPGRR